MVSEIPTTDPKKWTFLFNFYNENTGMNIKLGDTVYLPQVARNESKGTKSKTKKSLPYAYAIRVEYIIKEPTGRVYISGYHIYSMNQFKYFNENEDNLPGFKRCKDKYDDFYIIIDGIAGWFPAHIVTNDFCAFSEEDFEQGGNSRFSESKTYPLLFYYHYVERDCLKYDPKQATIPYSACRRTSTWKPKLKSRKRLSKDLMFDCLPIEEPHSSKRCGRPSKSSTVPLSLEGPDRKGTMKEFGKPALSKPLKVNRKRTKQEAQAMPANDSDSTMAVLPDEDPSPIPKRKPVAKMRRYKYTLERLQLKESGEDLLPPVLRSRGSQAIFIEEASDNDLNNGYENMSNVERPDGELADVFAFAGIQLAKGKMRFLEDRINDLMRYMRKKNPVAS